MLTIRMVNMHNGRVLTRMFDNPIIASQWMQRQIALGYEWDDGTPAPKALSTRDNEMTPLPTQAYRRNRVRTHLWMHGEDGEVITR